MGTPIEPTMIQRFRSLFSGLERNHGTYDVTGVEPDERGKRKGTALTIQRPLSNEIIRQHLAGVRSLGLVPIREDSTVRFGASVLS